MVAWLCVGMQVSYKWQSGIDFWPAFVPDRVQYSSALWPVHVVIALWIRSYRQV